MRRAVAPVLATCVVLASCGSGESILQAGNERAPATSPATTQPAGTTVPGQTTVPPITTAPPTTEPRLLDSLPPCHTDALDDAATSGPVELTFWHGMSNENGLVLEEFCVVGIAVIHLKFLSGRIFSRRRSMAKCSCFGQRISSSLVPRGAFR